MPNPDFGPEIAKGGPLWREDELRPGWLADDVRTIWTSDIGYTARMPWFAWEPQWHRKVSLRVPADHPASLCAQRALDHPEELPFYPWMGGEKAPEDWDGGSVLYRDLSTGDAGAFAGRWTHPHECYSRDPLFDIVGYCRKPALAAAPEGDGAGISLGARVEKISGSSWRGRVVGTYSTSLTPDGLCVESENEPGSVQIYPAKALRLIRPDTLAERYARETGRAVTPDVAHALEWAGKGGAA